MAVACLLECSMHEHGSTRMPSEDIADIIYSCHMLLSEAGHSTQFECTGIANADN